MAFACAPAAVRCPRARGSRRYKRIQRTRRTLSPRAGRAGHGLCDRHRPLPPGWQKPSSRANACCRIPGAIFIGCGFPLMAKADLRRAAEHLREGREGGRTTSPSHDVRRMANSQNGRISHCWTGFVGMTADHLPHMGTHEGVHYAVGCNGSGVAMMSYLGYQTARKILGLQNRPCAFDSDAFPAPALYNGEPWFVPIVCG